MTEKQKKFVDEYLICKDAASAYLSVYLNCKNRESAFALATKILEKQEVKKYMEDIRDKSFISKVADEDKNYCSEIATEEEIMRDFTDIARGKKAVDKDRFRALEVLGKTLVTSKKDEAVIVVFKGMDKLED